MTKIEDVSVFLDKFAPTRLAEDWDNVGLLVGDTDADVHRIMTCLTITPDSAAEAIDRKANLIVSHHPLPFRPIKKITTGRTPTKLLWQLINNGIAIYSPHTGFDSAADGINQSVCQRLNLTNIRPLIPIVDDPDQLGAGRIGELDHKLEISKFVDQLKQAYTIEKLRFVGSPENQVNVVASACGSGGSSWPRRLPLVATL